MESMRPRVYSVRGPDAEMRSSRKERNFFSFSKSSRRRLVDSRLDDFTAERGRGRQLHNAYNSCRIAV